MSVNVLSPRSQWMNSDGTPTPIFYKYITGLAAGGSGNTIDAASLEILVASTLESDEPGGTDQAALLAQMIGDTVDSGAFGGGVIPTYINPTPQAYGAKGDGVILEDGAITATLTAFTSASASFLPSDVGKQIGVMGAGTAGATLLTTIAAYVSGTHVTLTAAAVTTVTNAHYAYGTDDSAALASFFTAQKGLEASFQKGSVYISTAKQTCQLRSLKSNTCPIVFLIGNHTDNCFSVVPPIRGTLSQITSRTVFNGLFLDGMATGLYLLNQNDGSSAFYTLWLNNSYDTSFYLNPVQNASINTATYIENLTGTDWLFLNCGRHAMEIHLSGDGGNVNPGAFFNETNIFGWEIRNIGKRFGSGTGATASNAIRMTYDNVGNTGICKIEHFLVHGANWDCAVGGSLAGAAVGDVIYQNAINGTVSPNLRVEGFQIRPGGIESTDGSVAGPPLFINGNILAKGNWVECDIDQGQIFGWGVGIPPVMLVDPTDNNTYTENSPARGQFYRAAIARPTPSPFPSSTQPLISLPSYDAAPFGGYIDGAFRNSLVVSQSKGDMIAGGTKTYTFAFSNPLGSPIAQDFSQWPLHVIISSIPDVSNLSTASYAEFVVLISEQQSSNSTFVLSFIKYQNTSSNYAFTFTPSAVTFTTGGVNNNSFIVHVPGGASVGTAGSSPEAAVWLGRPFGIGERSRNTAAGDIANLAMGI